MRVGHIVAALLALAAACGDRAVLGPTGVSSPAEVVLRVGQEVRVDSDLRLTFLAVPEDSRCPTHFECFWQGDGAVAIAYAAGTGPSFADTLHTALDPRAAQFAGYAITLLALTPYPDNSFAIPAGRYAARFGIERLPQAQSPR
jgi:hypothetical protein